MGILGIFFIKVLKQCLHPKPQTDRKITDQMKRFCHRLFSVILLDFLLQLLRQKTIDGICYICKAKATSFVHIFPWTCMLCYLMVSNLFSSLWRLSHYVMSKCHLVRTCFISWILITKLDNWISFQHNALVTWDWHERLGWEKIMEKRIERIFLINDLNLNVGNTSKLIRKCHKAISCYRIIYHWRLKENGFRLVLVCNPNKHVFICHHASNCDCDQLPPVWLMEEMEFLTTRCHLLT